jgi:iron complex transport system ATP-binding protein
MRLEVKKLNFSYGSRKILTDISFQVPEGKLVCVLGANGVGKSTLFRCILGLNDKYGGEILINEESIKKLSIKELAKRVAFIPQSHTPTFNYKVIDIVLMSTTVYLDIFSSPGKAQRKIAQEALERVGISHLAQRGYEKISGGERQLALIARALAQQTKIIVMDEPTSSLDYGNQIRVLSQAKQLTREGYTIIQSIHHPDQAFLYADKTLVLHQGSVLRYGETKDIINEGVINKIYGINVELNSLYDDMLRVSVPIDEINRLKAFNK